MIATGTRSIIGAALVFMGALWLFAALMEGTTADEIAVNGVSTEGEVISLARSQSSSGKGWFPVVLFTDAAGEDHTFQSRVGTGMGRYDVGDEVDVIYLPYDPQSAIIDTFADRHTAHLVGAFAIIAIVIGLLLIRQDRRRSAPTNPWRPF